MRAIGALSLALPLGFRLWPLAFLLPAAFTSSATEFVPGKAYYGRSNYIEYLAGDLPVIFSAPHGGREKPKELPDRKNGTFAFDTNTQELAREIIAEFRARTGRSPHVIICRVTRRKIDCNREIVEGAAGHKLTESVWNEYHNFIDAAQKSVVAKSGRGFFIDLHGQGHKDQRLELGYAHDREIYAEPDAELNRPATIEQGTLRLFARTAKVPYTELIRGPLSFGALMEKEGFPSTPSPSKPVPASPYFNGGYNVRRYARDAADFAGVQIEANFKGVRDTEASRKKFARGLFNALKTYLDAHLGLKLDGQPAR